MKLYVASVPAHGRFLQVAEQAGVENFLAPFGGFGMAAIAIQRLAYGTRVELSDAAGLEFLATGVPHTCAEFEKWLIKRAK